MASGLSQDGYPYFRERIAIMPESPINLASHNEQEPDEDALARWAERILREMWLFKGDFQDKKGFDHVLPVHRCASLLEAILWKTARLMGASKASGSLRHAITAARKCGGIGDQSTQRLIVFNNIRNSVIHDIDFLLSNFHVHTLRQAMPREARARLREASLPLTTELVLLYGMTLRLTFQETQARIGASSGLSKHALRRLNMIDIDAALNATNPIPPGVLHEERTVERGKHVSRFYGDIRDAWDPFRHPKQRREFT
jgi:hypothetical protein